MTEPELSVSYLTHVASPVAKVCRLAYLRFERPDLDLAERFLNDFGLVTAHKDEQSVYLRSEDGSPWCYHVQRGTEARFIGFGFDCTALDDLNRLAAAHSTEVIHNHNELGGGQRVSLIDPNGFCVEINYGVTRHTENAHRAPYALNSTTSTTRVNRQQTVIASPPPLIKLGHAVIETPGYEQTVRWYMQNLGLIASDTQILADGAPVVTFFRMNLGDQPADHHTLAIAHTFQSAFSHAAFETIDIDAIGAGQQWLKARHWSHAWGIGRHILGSQLFDYWSDPWGTHHEHYADGDVYTANQPLGVSLASASVMSQWGQTMPAAFIRPKFSFKLLKTLVSNLCKYPDLTLSKLLAIAKVMN